MSNVVKSPILLVNSSHMCSNMVTCSSQQSDRAKCDTFRHSSLRSVTKKSFNSRTMGRGKAWSVEENELLAKVWILTSEDPIVGMDQVRKIFIQTVRGWFVDMSPALCQDRCRRDVWSTFRKKYSSTFL